MKNVTIRVDGIRNDTEKQHIKNALDKIEGVEKVAVDPTNRTINVEYNPPSTEQEIVVCIKSMGHETN